jgi:hypothetical protein
MQQVGLAAGIGQHNIWEHAWAASGADAGSQHTAWQLLERCCQQPAEVQCRATDRVPLGTRTPSGVSLHDQGVCPAGWYKYGVFKGMMMHAAATYSLARRHAWH